MLHFSRFKTALILGICLVGSLLSLPNLFTPGTLPHWVPQPRVNLGLDLQGGSYLLLEVDMSSVIRERIASTRAAMAS